ncbi:hypothetical protein, partial [Lactococcus petauri]|uniref:hypothetical protein n=1 Tax=Lactococcus petauri TaxID=1940789 RepID=UPI0021F0B7DB
QGMLTFTFSSFTGTRTLNGLEYVVNTPAGSGQWVHSQTKHTVAAGLAMITKFTANSYCRDGFSIGWGASETSITNGLVLSQSP